MFIVRVKFPETYPLVFKTLRVDPNFKTSEAIRFIVDSVNCTEYLQGTESLFIPEKHMFLDDNTPLYEYSLEQAEVVEIRQKHILEPDENIKSCSCCLPI